MKRKSSIFISIAVLILTSLACGFVEVGGVTPTNENNTVSVLNTLEPSPVEIGNLDEIAELIEEPKEDFSHLWAEYWNPKYGYGIALPSHWIVQNDFEGGYMSASSYDEEYFNANSIKGNWIDGITPEGTVKLDFVPFDGVIPDQSLEVAISNILGADPSETIVLSVEEITVGEHDAVLTTTARTHNLEDTVSSIAIRLSPDVILLVATYPNTARNSSDVQAILNSLVLDKSIPITKPNSAPAPPLLVGE